MGVRDCRERQQQSERRFHKRHAANLRRGQQAASARREQKLSANPLPLQPAIYARRAKRKPARHGVLTRAV